MKAVDFWRDDEVPPEPDDRLRFRAEFRITKERIGEMMLLARMAGFPFSTLRSPRPHEDEAIAAAKWLLKRWARGPGGEGGWG
jgi:hypothetical protein